MWIGEKLTPLIRVDVPDLALREAATAIVASSVSMLRALVFPSHLPPERIIREASFSQRTQ